ncbi:hypothetical protein GCM10010495_38210 [Kitasatospora herbaricolor]|uniref:hypothetical protein n=1 Tax=Kitasatospora herbaricolor TaxID=68217 RepID=UPI00174C81D8|nr:hypothetical protein [Kitasatospora herbaricolor]MDQ0306887.1 hypothetical protein [Kitasatospora herbaricolor]GGV19471.1 hypothetical protein GCM10010495_38210 [Kitasatospora herbaricolor]
MNRKIGATVATVALGLGGVVLASTPASAVPTCAVVNHGTYGGGDPWVDVNNRCTSTIRVKVIFNWGRDSACTSIPFGTTHRFNGDSTFASYEDVVNC